MMGMVRIRMPLTLVTVRSTLSGSRSLNCSARASCAVLETHSGGGVYRVASDRFCLDLPEKSILGRRQRAAGLAVPEGATAFYSASGDQALSHIPAACKYVAFDTNAVTGRRLAAVANWRERTKNLDSRPYSYAGNGDPATGLPALIQALPKPLLVMADPFELGDLERASRGLEGLAGARCIFFGVTRHRSTADSESGWRGISEKFRGQSRITWKWTGNAGRHDNSRNLFFLLMTTAVKEEGAELFQKLANEHKLLSKARGSTHAYASDGPKVMG